MVSSLNLVLFCLLGHGYGIPQHQSFCGHLGLQKGSSLELVSRHLEIKQWLMQSLLHEILQTLLWRYKHETECLHRLLT